MTKLPPLSIVTRSIAKRRREMSSELVNEPVSTASDFMTTGPQAPPGFGPEALRDLHDRRQKLQNDNAFLREQVAAVQHSMDQ